MNFEASLLGIINDELLADQPGVSVNAQTELLLDGIIDSLGVMRLVTQIEATCRIAVPPEDVTIDHFRTVAVLAAYLAARDAAAQARSGGASG